MCLHGVNRLDADLLSFEVEREKVDVVVREFSERQRRGILRNFGREWEESGPFTADEFLARLNREEEFGDDLDDLDIGDGDDVEGTTAAGATSAIATEMELEDGDDDDEEVEDDDVNEDV